LKPVDIRMKTIPARTWSRIVLRDVECDTGLAEGLFRVP